MPVTSQITFAEDSTQENQIAISNRANRKYKIGISYLLFLFLFAAIGNSVLIACSPEQPANTQLPEKAWEAVDRICNSIMERHISPPTRQQLILAAAKGIYLSRGERIPAELSHEISGLTTNAEFREVLDNVWADCLDAEQTQQTAEDDQAISAMLDSMVKTADTRGRLIDAKTLRVEKQLSENRYVGIGIQVAWQEGYAVITDPFVGGAAKKAGSRPGDRILEVDGDSTKGWTFARVIDELRGHKDSRVVVKVSNVHDEKPAIRTLDMIRTTIPIPTVKGTRRNEDESWNFANPQLPGVACLKFDRVVGSTAAELKTLAREIENQEFPTVLLDFRMSGDMEFHHALMLVDALTGEHDLGTSIERGLANLPAIRTRQDHVLKDKTILVMCDSVVDGAKLMILQGLMKRDAILVGSQPVRSLGRYGGRVELGKEFGAISYLSTGHFSSNDLKKHSVVGRDINGANVNSYGVVSIQPRLGSAEEFIRNARRKTMKQKTHN